jgi:hypothetical protein
LPDDKLLDPKNRDKLQIPTSELNQLQLKFVKGEVWPEKFFDLMRLSGTNPIRLLLGALVFILGLLAGYEDLFFGIALLFLSMSMIFCELLSSVQTSCVLSNYQSMYYSGLLELPEIEEVKKW